MGFMFLALVALVARNFVTLADAGEQPMNAGDIIPGKYIIKMKDVVTSQK
jgi:hypothetical protein